LLKFYLFALAMLAATSARAGAGLDQLNGFLDGLQSLAATFEQSVYNTENSSTGTFKGQFLLKRPQRFRWNYTAPYQQDIIADGNWVWVVDKDLEQVSQQAQKEALRGTPALVLLADADINKQFEIVELGEHQGLQWLELIPRDAEGPFERLQLGLADHKLQRMETRDRFGQISRFVFGAMERNLELPDKLFVYTPSAEYDVFAH
jgi:outer membrane lipoprotein carrier protein